MIRFRGSPGLKTTGSFEKSDRYGSFFRARNRWLTDWHIPQVWNAAIAADPPLRVVFLGIAGMVAPHRFAARAIEFPYAPHGGDAISVHRGVSWRIFGE
jgi:hypothetical protein